MDDLIQEKVVQKENELNATYDEKMRNYEAREQDLQSQLALTKNQLRDLRTSNESNQAKLLDHTQRQGIRDLLPMFISIVLTTFGCQIRKLFRSSLNLTSWLLTSNAQTVVLSLWNAEM